MKKIVFLLTALALVAVASIAALANGHELIGVSGLMLAAGPIAFPSMFQSKIQLSRTEQTLIEWCQKNHPELASKLSSGQLRLKDDFIYVRWVLQGVTTAVSGVVEFYNQTTNESVGITNVDKGRLDKDTAFVVERIQLGFVTTGTGTNPAAVTGYSSDVGGFPAFMRNGELEIWQDNNLINKVPVHLIGSQADSNLPVGVGDCYKLATPIVLAPEKQIRLKLAFAGSDAGIATTRFAEITLIGSSTRQRGQM